MMFSKYRITIIFLFMLQLLLWGTPAQAEQERTVTYRQVLRQVMQHNPAILAGQMEVLKKEWLWRQTKTWTNPNIEIELENFGGNIIAVEEEPAELTATISQPLELGGKRGKKRQMALYSWDLAKKSAEGLRLDMLQLAGEGFITLLATQELERYAVEFYQQSQKMHDLVKAQVEVGKVSPLILKKASVLLADATIALNKAKRRRQDARQRLSVLWQDMEASFKRANGSLDKRYRLPSQNALWERVKESPEARAQRVLENLNKTAISREKAVVIPDIEITGGIRKLRHIEGHKWVAALSLQLPLWNWNRGNINAAKYQLKKSKAEAKDFMNRLRVEFQETFRQWTSAGEEANILETESLPAVARLYDGMLEGYKAGKFSFLEVLDARQTLNGSKQRYIKVLHKYHRTALKLARMSGTTLDRLLADEEPF
jgi:outer membrane protein, heavy metal efflux system